MTTRIRTTWTKNDGAAPARQAATSRRADIYTMNQDHPQPGLADYSTGDPDAWAETPTDNKNVEAEYQGGAVKRNEIGFGEFRDDTFKHKDSEKWNDGKRYDNQRTAAERKAMAAERIARALPLASETDVAETAMELMALPPKAMVATLKRLEKKPYEHLSAPARHRRGLACVKLAARTLGYSADVTDPVRLAHVRDLGSLYMGLGDDTLKGMLKVVASARVAEDVTDEVQDHSATEDKVEDLAPETAGEGCLPPAESAMLDSMLAPAPMAPAPAAPAAIVAPPAPASPVDELEAIFQGGAPAPMPAPMGMPAAAAVASDDSDISFDDEEGEDAHVAADSDQAELDSIFADHPEVVAQREALAAQVGGYSPSSRTASTKGAKKLGNVQASKATEEDVIARNLWG